MVKVLTPSYYSDFFYSAVATPEEAGRVRKYEESMARKASEEERRNAENEFLRLSLRNSQKLRKLEELRRNQQAQVQVDGGGFGGGTVYEDGLQLQDQLHPHHNPAFSHDEDDCGEDGGGALSNLLAALNSKDLVQSVERLRGDVNLVSTEPDLGRKLDKVRALFEDKRFQDSLKFAQKVRDWLRSHYFVISIRFRSLQLLSDLILFEQM